MKSPHPSRERILLYGREGSGKTKAALDFAEANDGNTWIVSNDNSIERLLESDEHNLTNYELTEVTDWVGYRHTLLDYFNRAERDDVLIIDNITWPWVEVKSWFVKEAYGEDWEDWAFKYRMGLDKGADGSPAISLFGDYSHINSQWYPLHNKVLVQSKCHLVMTAHAKQVRTDSRADKDVKDAYGIIGMAPDTQKAVGGTCQTVVYMWSDSGGYYFTTKAKDRGRESRSVEKLPWDDFATDYLQRIALWTDTPTPVGKKRRKI